MVVRPSPVGSLFYSMICPLLGSSSLLLARALKIEFPPRKCDFKPSCWLFFGDKLFSLSRLKVFHLCFNVFSFFFFVPFSYVFSFFLSLSPCFHFCFIFHICSFFQFFIFESFLFFCFLHFFWFFQSFNFFGGFSFCFHVFWSNPQKTLTIGS